MEGQIAELLHSEYPHHKEIVREVFGPRFHDLASWRSFLRGTLNDNASSMLRAPTARWQVSSFQALFIACWIHKPVEKGTFMINLMGLSVAQRDQIKEAYKKRLYGRKSSHLSGSGRSASKGWEFLNGYHELLVQLEETRGKPYMLLKAEGHTTGPSGVIPHLQSWVHKKKHGEGLMASEALNQLAKFTPMVAGRAAENYGKAYKELLKEVLGFHGKEVTIRDMIGVLFEKANYHVYPASLTMTENNHEVGLALEHYCNDASIPGAGINFRIGGKVTDEMIADLRLLADTLKADGDVFMPRVFNEVRVNPAEIDQSLNYFYTYA
jgi:hypothetical protein